MAAQQKLKPAIELAKKNGVRFPNESAEYRKARDLLLAEEIELRRHMERVAEQRRALPPGGKVTEDYVFDAINSSGLPGKVKLSELFAPGKDSLIAYSFMFPRDPEDERPPPREGATARLKREEGPCPSCTAFLDQLDGAAEHVGQHVNFVVIGKAPLERLAAFAKERGWRKLRLVSSAGNRFKRDYHAETPEGFQRPLMIVFHRNGSEIRHFWSSEMFYVPTDSEQDPRHVGVLEPLWNLFDLTPEGRPNDWNEQLHYPQCLARTVRK